MRFERLFKQLLMFLLLLLGSAAAQCGGTERWAVKDGTDPKVNQVDLSHIQDVSVQDLIAIAEPNLPSRDDNTTRVVPDETHVYRVQARLVKWKEEAGETGDNDYHLVLTDDTLKYTQPHKKPTGHSLIGEIPDPDCLSGAHGDFGGSSPFLPASSDAQLSIRGARRAIEAQFPDAVFDGGWNDAGGIPVEIIGVSYFDPPHGQVGRAPNNLEIHPILSITFPEQSEFAAVHAAAMTEAHGSTGINRPTRATEAAATGTSGPHWQYTMITANSADKLLASANALGSEGWEMVSVAVDTNRPDRYVGYLKRPRK